MRPDSTPACDSARCRVANAETNVETIGLKAGFSYSLTTDDATVASGAALTVDASALGAGNALSFDGSAETDGTFTIIGGTGADHFIGDLSGHTFLVIDGNGITGYQSGGDIVIDITGAANMVDFGTGNFI